MDPFGVLPLYLSVSQNYEKSRRFKILTLSILTAFLVGFLFLLFGPKILFFLGISLSDFQIAGGIVLFALALVDLVLPSKSRRSAGVDYFGIVPLGVPILVGPAVFTTLLLLKDDYGNLLTALAFAANILFTFALFFFAIPVSRLLGDSGIKIISKIAMLLLASIGVMMVRRGILQLIG